MKILPLGAELLHVDGRKYFLTLNKNANQMYFVLKILKILFTLFRSTCFRHHCAHHQELLSCTCSLWSRVVLGLLCPPVLLCCNTAGLEDTTNEAPHGTRDCMCS